MEVSRRLAWWLAVLLAAPFLLGGRQPWSAEGVSSLELENVVQLVTEPASLIPHSYTWTKTIRGTQEGEIELEERTDRLEVLYSYR